MMVAGIQMDIAWNDPATNHLRARDLAIRAAAVGARLAVLPEMFATGFAVRSPEVGSFANATRDELASTAREHRMWVVGGYAEPAGTKLANALSVMAPDGSEALHYRKIHPFSLAGEPDRFVAGEALATVEIDGVRTTPVICYDLRFPEIFRAAAVQTDLFLVIANWPERRAHAWRTLLAARALDGQCFVLGVNRVGDAEGVAHAGHSALIDPLGQTVTSLQGQEGLVLGDVDPERARWIRERFGFLADRRPGLYPHLER